MLRIGVTRARSCQGYTRREMLQIGSIGVAGLGLPDWLRLKAEGAVKAGRARSVIWLWLWGGPSHLDTFDLKPQAQVQYRGPFRPMATNVPGIEICELLPRLATVTDKYCIIRSMQCESADHGIAATIGLTGDKQGAIKNDGQPLPGAVRPNHGAIVARARGFSPGRPSFVTLGDYMRPGIALISGEGGGLLGATYDPFRLNYDPQKGVQLPQLKLPKEVGLERLKGRRQLQEAFDSLQRHLEKDRQIEKWDSFHQQAFDLVSSAKARQVYNLEEEPVAVRSRYGRFRFGQCCLLARRLVEAQVPFVQVNWSSHVAPLHDGGDGGWDLHKHNFNELQERHCWMLDQSLSALLEDLERRGLLQETVVVAVGEFGRTPKINSNGGRDHWGKCYSAIVAGGGIHTGQVVGASDRRAAYPVTPPVSPADLATTVFDRIGIGVSALTEIGLTPLGEVVEDLI